MESLRRTLATLFIGASAGAIVALALRPGPPDRSAELAAHREFAERLDRLGADLDRTRQEMAVERARAAQWRRRIERYVPGEFGPSEGGPVPAGASFGSASPGAAPLDPASLEIGPLAALARAFARLAAGGAIAANGPAGHEVLDRIEALGSAGVAYLAAELMSPRVAHRLAAAGIAERRSDPALIAPLAAAARDEVPEVRRAAARALAALDRPESAETLIGLLDGPPDDGFVRFHAWQGLARLGHPEAAARFPAILAAATGEPAPDLVVDAALAIEDPALLPALRHAFDRPGVSIGLRVAILRRLARSGTEERDAFLAEIAADESAPLPLRETARTLLGK